MSPRRRNLSQPDPLAQRQQVARQLAERLGTSPKLLRFVEVWYHDGSQWTCVSYWEQQIDGKWHQVPWTAY
ncbi:MAG: hypothetical protein NXI32_26380 [bacterium]|nr:hypothetical protein [bacterium]